MRSRVGFFKLFSPCHDPLLHRLFDGAASTPSTHDDDASAWRRFPECLDDPKRLQWQDFIRHVFHDAPDVLAAVDGARCVVRQLHHYDMKLMVESSLVMPSALDRMLQGKRPLVCRCCSQGCSFQGDVPCEGEARVPDEEGIGGAEQEGGGGGDGGAAEEDEAVASVCRLIELYTEATVNAFFVCVNGFGDGLMYARYGARHWKH